MIKSMNFFNIFGDGERHEYRFYPTGAKRLVFAVDYVFPPEAEDFVNDKDYEPSTSFIIRVAGKICDLPFFPLPIEQNDAMIGKVMDIHTRRGLYAVDVDGLDEVKVVLDTEPPTDYQTEIRVVGNLIG